MIVTLYLTLWHCICHWDCDIVTVTLWLGHWDCDIVIVTFVTLLLWHKLWLWHLFSNSFIDLNLLFQSDFVSIHTQGVMKVRKRVTLMMLTVTAMFGICWLTDIIAHVVEHHTSYRMDKVVFTVIHTVILFNSAVNPFVYALINTNFREKIKGMLCFTGCAVVSVNPAREPQNIDIEIAPVTPPQINTAGPCSSKWCVYFNYSKQFLF